MAVVDELVAILGYEVKGEEKLRRFTQSIDDAARRVATFAAAAATAAAGAAALLGRSVVQTTAQFESFQATLETVEGSAEKARASLDWISDFAKRTPFEVEELTRSFVKLRAYGMDPTTGLLEDLGNASSAMGKSLMDAVEMIADASTGEFERLKEFGIRASQAGDQVTFSWTENGKTLSKTVKKSGDEITKFIQERFGARFSGAMLRQSKTWNGMMSNLSDSWTDFQRRIGEAGFFDAVKNQLGKVLDFIARLDADGSLDRWAQNLSWAFTAATDAIGSFATRVGRHLGTIADIINNNREAWDWLKWVLGAIALRLFPVAAMFAAAAFALDDFLTYMRGGQSVLGDFIQALADFLGAEPQQVADALKAIAAGAGMLAAAAIGVSLFAGSLRSLAGALGMMGGAQAAAGIGNIGKAGKAVDGIRRPGFGLMSMLGLQSAISMGSGTLEEGKARGASLNKWFEENIGTPRSWLGKIFSGNGGGSADGSVSARPGQTVPELAQIMSNLQGNTAKMSAGTSGAAVQNNVNDSSDKSVNVTINQTVQQATDAPAAAASATANAAAGAASRSLPPPRFVPGGV